MIITTIQDNIYLCWQAELLYWNCKQLGSSLTILIGYRTAPSAYALGLAQHCSAILLEDTRKDLCYAPSLQPHLLGKIANNNSGPAILVDSDVLFKKLPTASSQVVTGSDCHSYLSANYLAGCGAWLLEALCDIAEIPSDYVRGKQSSPGAQYLLPNLLTPEFWCKVEENSIKMYETLKASDTKVQVWTASMWAILYAFYDLELKGLLKVGTNEALRFCFATDPIEYWSSCDILHCAGVHEATDGFFFKGDYTTKTPFNIDLSHVQPDNCSWVYARAVQIYSKIRTIKEI